MQARHMIAPDEIEKIARTIGQAAHAERVILFGSQARGTPVDSSDVDLLVIAESNQPRHKRSRDLYRRIRPYPFAMDILVYTPQEVQRGNTTPVSFISQVLREGKTVYVRGT
jgi:predicted nucleotidyltransferase